MKKALWRIGLVVILVSVAAGGAYADQPGAAAEFDQNHRLWTAVLKKYVAVKDRGNLVRYASLKNDAAGLEEYLRSLGKVSKTDFDAFSENDRLAFLINAYNALTVKLILDRYPVKSIKDTGTIFKNPWKRNFFTLFGEKHALDDIEHEWLRKKFSEPRIHFALVCASKGCPSLRNEAYVGNRLDQQLGEAEKEFLTNQDRNRYLPKDKRLELSSIFKWYGEDFAKKFGSLENYLAARITADPEEQQLIRNKKVSIVYLDYDWSLNEEK